MARQPMTGRCCMTRHLPCWALHPRPHSWAVPSNLAGEGVQLREALFKHLKRAGPGFESGLPHGPPLLSTRTCICWKRRSRGWMWAQEVNGRALADELGELALSHLIDPATGMLHESFDNSWKPTRDAAGRLVEPGHQFEWAFLLMRWGPA